jgi:hypothetical protein
MQWLRTFRDGQGTFPNPSKEYRRHSNQNRIPILFQNNPNLYSSFVQYANSNLSTLSGEMLHDYLFSIALPAVVKKSKTDATSPIPSNSYYMTTTSLL